VAEYIGVSMFIPHNMRAVDRLFENLMREFDVSTPLKAVDKLFPKEGASVKMYKMTPQEYEYQKCGECGTLHLVEKENEPDSDKMA
jgi:hypothetical protein